jgi:hypothetical protein
MHEGKVIFCTMKSRSDDLWWGQRSSAGESRFVVSHAFAKCARMGQPAPGGVRKVRFAARGKGKSGGVQVIYYFFDEENPLYAIFLYGKNEQANLSPEQKREVAGFVATIKAAAKVRRIR